MTGDLHAAETLFDPCRSWRITAVVDKGERDPKASEADSLMRDRRPSA